MAEKGHKFDHFKVGDQATITKIITDEIVRGTAVVSGDDNPMHLDDTYAATTIFGQRIAHGLVCLGMISTLVGTKLPGIGCVLINENVNYKKPVYINEEITAIARIENIISERDRAEISVVCKKTDGTVVLDGLVTVTLM